MTVETIALPRRHVLLGAAASVAAAAAPSLAVTPARAAAPQIGPDRPGYRRFMLGEFEIVPLLDGLRPGDGPHPTFGANQPPEAVEALMTANFLPPKQMVNSFTPVLVNTGREVVLFDTGLGEGARPAMGGLRDQMAAAGYKPEQVDIVVLTHMHGDHIGGLMEGNAPAFPNARYVTGAAEYDFWTKTAPSTPAAEAAKTVEAKVVPLAEKMTFLNDGGSVVSGITAMAAIGHTPGHMIYNLESGGRRLVLTADTANHYVASLQKPDWEVRFDADKAKAAETRKQVFGMLAADKVPFIGYHMPFPAVGFVEPLGAGFRFVPASYQFDV